MARTQPVPKAQCNLSPSTRLPNRPGPPARGPASQFRPEPAFSPNRPQAYRRTQVSGKSPSYPTLRANPFPEATDLFCRLPLPTLYYPPEAANLGGLMRILVRTGARKYRSVEISGAVGSAPNVLHGKTLFPPFSPLSRRTDFRVIRS